MTNDEHAVPPVIALGEKLARMSDPWTPKVVAQLNDYHCKLAKLEGAFVWHSHPETDELFLVVEGEMGIAFRGDRTVRLRPGEMIVVPAGMEHKPFAETSCSVLLIEPAGTVNTGDTGGDRTAPADDWI